jgi:hypothetical protein
MPYHPFFDAMQYPWGRADAAAFHDALYRTIIKPTEIELVYQLSGGTRPLTPNQAPHLAWKEILDHATIGRCLKQLCTVVLASGEYLAAHAAAIAVRDAEDDILPRPLLPQDIVFLDRKDLRLELEKLSQPGARGVLLVRGPSGVGKTWTEQLISSLATNRGASSVFIYEGAVSNVRDVIEEIFAALGDRKRMPHSDTTDPAWYRTVCLDLQEFAKQTRQFLWVVADDLGEDANGPRIDREIRAFFMQFGLHMANPAFAQWFRLVLLDYPEGPVPTNWRAWSEDRPNENEIDQALVADFLLKWAKYKQKNLGADRAKELANDIMAKVAAPPAPDQDSRRLPRIHAELTTVLKTL